ncbi:MAG: carboxypeptidase regulatory-like domain-containing protein, partial [Pyrinomonadaceae bacterium]|nr:carboxypeptidase regulatory-like domain-containing protein [Pyrinomonadaceae bacterium]
IGWHGSGNWQLNGSSNLTLEAVQIQLAGTSGSVEFNDGTANGDIDYIYLKNDVGGFSGGGGISASSSLTTSGIDLEKYCATFFTQNGKFTGNRTVDCAGPFTRNCLPKGKIIVKKHATPPSPFQFDFMTTNLTPTNFNLIDNDIAMDPMVMFEVTDFSTIKTIDEINPGSYTLSSIVCNVVGSGGTPTPVRMGNAVNINLQPGDEVTCTFNNDFLTAATVTVSGRVLDMKGRGLPRAFVTVMDASGNVRSAVTNHFGYYRVLEVEAGGGHVVSARHKIYRFPSRLINANDDVTGIDFYPSN